MNNKLNKEIYFAKIFKITYRHYEQDAVTSSCAPTRALFQGIFGGLPYEVHVVLDLLWCHSFCSKASFNTRTTMISDVLTTDLAEIESIEISSRQAENPDRADTSCGDRASSVCLLHLRPPLLELFPS
jgi:hypothetical protein